MKDKILKFFLILLVIIIILISIICLFKSSKNKNTYVNNFYNESISKINEMDFCVGDIRLNMSMQEVKDKLGEPKEFSEFVDNEQPEASYKRFDYDNLIIQFDYQNEYVNYIASSRDDYKNSRGIKAKDTITDILKKYYAQKNIEIYEDTYGRYEILYGKEDAINYLNDLNSLGKTFAYIYKHNDEIYSTIFVENGKIIEFYLNDNKINMIIVAEKYIPW